MTGATGNVYCGLHDYTEMLFLLHLLRPGDLFLDIGANVGTYTVLAAGFCRTQVLALEPVPATIRALEDNVRLNNISELVTIVKAGAGEDDRIARMTFSSDTTNRVLDSGVDREDTIAVPMVRVDSLIGKSGSPILIKIDVEGYERSVLTGALSVLRDPQLKAIIAEDNGNEANYAQGGPTVSEILSAAGFVPVFYEPTSRKLSFDTDGTASDNKIFVRHPDFVQARLNGAPKVSIRGRSF